MRRVHRIVAGAIALLGGIHVAITPSVSDTFDASALWFAGSGLFLIAAGLLNLAAVRVARTDAFITYSTLGVNALGVGMALWAIPTVGGPPSYLLLLLFGTAAGLTIRSRSMVDT